MRLCLLLIVLGGNLFAQNSWYLAGSPAPQEPQFRNTRQEFFAYGESATVLVTGEVLKLQESSYIDDFGTRHWHCQMLLDRVAYSRSFHVKDHIPLKTRDTIQFDFTTSHSHTDSDPVSSKLQPKKKAMVFLSINNTPSLSAQWELRSPVFKVNKHLFSEYKTSLWYPHRSSPINNELEKFRQVETKKSFLGREIFIDRKYDRENNLVCKIRQVAYKRNKFRTGMYEDPGKYIMHKVVYTWYDGKGKIIKRDRSKTPANLNFSKPVEKYPKLR